MARNFQTTSSVLGQLGDACTFNSDCSTDLICGANRTCTVSSSTRCHTTAETCSTNAQCCGGLECTSSQCTAITVPTNTSSSGGPTCFTSGPCVTSSQCCGGYACTDLACTLTTECGIVGTACTTSAQCCGGMVCDASWKCATIGSITTTSSSTSSSGATGCHTSGACLQLRRLLRRLHVHQRGL